MADKRFIHRHIVFFIHIYGINYHIQTKKKKRRETSKAEHTKQNLYRITCTIHNQHLSAFNVVCISIRHSGRMELTMLVRFFFYSFALLPFFFVAFCWAQSPQCVRRVRNIESTLNATGIALQSAKSHLILSALCFLLCGKKFKIKIATKT